MIEANEINSTFYALRLLSHGLDTSQIEVTDGEEYPASEFTREEQEQALKIIHSIEDSESACIRELPPEKIAFYLTSLGDRIEELANSDLVNAGYTLQLPPAPFFEGAHLSPGRAEPVELTPRQLEVLSLVAEGRSAKDIARTLGISVQTVRTHRAQVLLRLWNRSRQLNKTEPEGSPSAQRS